MKMFEFPKVEIIEIFVEDIMNESLDDDNLGEWG